MCVKDQVFVCEYEVNFCVWCFCMCMSSALSIIVGVPPELYIATAFWASNIIEEWLAHFPLYDIHIGPFPDSEAECSFKYLSDHLRPQFFQFSE